MSKSWGKSSECWKQCAFRRAIDYMSTHKLTNRTPDHGLVPDVGDPTSAFQMALSKLPHFDYSNHHLILEFWHQKLVAQNPKFHELHNLLVEFCLCLLARWHDFDVFDQLIFDALGVDPEHKPVKYLAVHILENVCLRFAFLELTIERRLENRGCITCEGCRRVRA